MLVNNNSCSWKSTYEKASCRWKWSRKHLAAKSVAEALASDFISAICKFFFSSNEFILLYYVSSPFQFQQSKQCFVLLAHHAMYQLLNLLLHIYFS